MASLADYHAALAAFALSPTEATKLGVLTARDGLPDVVVVDGVSTTLPDGKGLADRLSAMIAGAVPPDRRRLIRTGLSP